MCTHKDAVGQSEGRTTNTRCCSRKAQEQRERKRANFVWLDKRRSAWSIRLFPEFVLFTFRRKRKRLVQQPLEHCARANLYFTPRRENISQQDTLLGFACGRKWTKSSRSLLAWARPTDPARLQTLSIDPRCPVSGHGGSSI